MTMDVIIALATAFFAGIMLLAYYNSGSSSGLKAKLPPGPKPWPFVGNIFDMKAGASHKLFNSWTKIYGKIFTVWFGTTPAVIVNDAACIREVLIHQGTSCASRPSTYLGKIHSSYGYGIVLAPYGPDWKFCRKLAHHAMTMYGDKKSKTESKLIKECNSLVERIKRSSSHQETINPRMDVSLTVTNIIVSILFGTTYEETDPEFLSIFRNSINFNEGLGKLRLLNLSKIFLFLKRKEVTEMKNTVESRNTFIQQKINEHRKSFDANDIRDFIDALIDKANASIEDEEISEEQERMIEEQIKISIADLLFAGVDTTLNTLLWAIMYLALWPNMQEKAYTEIKAYLKSNDVLTYSKRELFPYLQAVIFETLRLSSISTLGVGHQTINAIRIGDYEIPAGFMLITNLYALHHDKDVWAEPFMFKPDRFLDIDGSVYMPNDSFLPFGSGPRSCLGESLAKTELFFILGTLLLNFKIVKPNDGWQPNLDGALKAVLEPVPFTVKFQQR